MPPAVGELPRVKWNGLVSPWDLGCIPISGNLTFDCSPILNDFFHGLSNNDLYGCLDLAGEGWRCNSTLDMEYGTSAGRTAIAITGCGGCGGVTEAYSIQQFDGGSNNKGGPAGRLYWGGGQAFGNWAGPLIHTSGFGHRFQGVTFCGFIATGASPYTNFNAEYPGQRCQVGLDVDRTGDVTLGTGKMVIDQCSFYNFDSGCRFGNTGSQNSDNFDIGYIDFSYCDEGFEIKGFQAVDFLVRYLHGFAVKRAFKITNGGKVHVLYGNFQKPGTLFDVSGNALDTQTKSMYRCDGMTLDDGIMSNTWDGRLGYTLVHQHDHNAWNGTPSYHFHSINFPRNWRGSPFNDDQLITGTDRYVFNIEGPAQVTLQDSHPYYEESIHATKLEYLPGKFRGPTIVLDNVSFVLSQVDAYVSSCIEPGSWVGIVPNATLIWRDCGTSTGMLFPNESVEQEARKATGIAPGHS